MDTFRDLEVASYLARELTKKGYLYNNTKIQKLMYAVYGASLVLTGQRICDDYPRAWPFGPVFPRIFTFIDRGGDIASFSTNFDEFATDKQKECVHFAVNELGHFNATSLVNWSHKQGTPWDFVINRDKMKWNSYIPDDLIKDYFSKAIEYEE